MDEKNNKQAANDALLKEEAERKKKLEEAKKEIGTAETPHHKKAETDEQDSDGSANAFRGK